MEGANVFHRTPSIDLDLAGLPMPEVLCRADTVVERGDIEAIADFSYAEELGTPISPDEKWLAAGPARLTFGNGDRSGTVCVTDRQTLLVWLDRDGYRNSNYPHGKLLGWSRLGDGGIGYAFTWSTEGFVNRVPGSVPEPEMTIGLSPVLRNGRKNRSANRHSLEWYYTLGSQVERALGRSPREQE